MAVNVERLIGQFCELVSIDSLSFHEREMADHLLKKAGEIGFELHEDNAAEKIGGNAGNLYGYFRSENKIPGSRPVLFIGHTDTVPPGNGKRAVVHEDGKITSDGTTVLGADDAAAIAEILEAIREIKEEGLPHRDVELLFPAAEEAYTVGSSAADLTRFEAKEAFVLDISGPVGGYTSTEPTLISFTVKIHGKAAHAGFEPEKGVNSILAASRAISKLPIGRPDDHSTFNVGLIEGGAATNVIPELVTVQGEIRSTVHEDALALYDRALAVFQEEAQAVGGNAEGERIVHLTAYKIEDGDPALLTYRKVLEKNGIAPIDRRSFGGSDNNVLRRKKINGICIANAMNDIHTCEEYSSVSEMAQVTQIVKDIMLGTGEIRE